MTRGTHTVKVILTICILSLSGCTLGDKHEEVKQLDCGVYLKIVSWGLTGDNKRTYIGTTPNLNDTTNEPYFKTLDFFTRLRIAH